MINSREENKGIERVKTIDINNIKEINSYSQLIDELLYITENINIDISDFIMENNIFGYDKKIDIEKAIKEVISLKNDLIEEKDKETSSLKNVVSKIEDKPDILEILELTASYYMYLGNFTKGLALINLYNEIKKENKSSVITNIEFLNEYIMKYNLSLDLMIIENYNKACEMLESYYKQNIRLERGDQFLIILYECLGKDRDSKKIKESIKSISKNSIFDFDQNKVNISKTKVATAVGILLILFVGGGLFFKNNFSNTNSKDIAVNNPNVKVIEEKSTKKDEGKELINIKKEEPIVKEEKANKVTIEEIEIALQNLKAEKDIETVSKQIDLLEDNKDKKYKEIKSTFINKKQAYYYNLGKQKLKENKVDESIKNLKVAYDSREGEYLDSHVTYYMAIAVKEKDITECKKYYKEYLEKYGKEKNSPYSGESLYNLAIINWEEGNKEEAKKYAKKIKNNYPNSIYNNEKIKNIIE